MDGEVRLFKRKYSKVWQVAFTLDGRQVRVSSKKRILMMLWQRHCQTKLTGKRLILNSG